MLSFLFCFIFLTANAQEHELEKVTIEELQQKVHPIDTAAPAAILFKKARTFFVYKYGLGFIVNHEYEIKIKIYKKEGLNWANYGVPFYVDNQDKEIQSLKFKNCITYNEEGGTILQTKLNNEGDIKLKINNDWNEYFITMPNVKVGSIMEIKFSYKSNVGMGFPNFDFQYDIPVNYAEYTTDIPEMLGYKSILIGYCKVNSDIQTIQESKSLAHKFNQDIGYQYKCLQSKYTAENIPVMKEEPFVDNISNYRGSIHHEIEYTRLPNKKVEDYSNSWEGVTKKVYDLDNFGKELNKQNYYEKDLNNIIANAKTDSEKLNIIFKFVQQRMNWNKRYGIVTKKGVKQAYIDKSGNTAEINFILNAMLRSAGIKSNPVLISTTRNGVPSYPNLTIFNAIIIAAQINNETILLDARSKYNAPNTLPTDDLNWVGRLIKKDGESEEINLAPTTKSKENIILSLSINEKGIVKGEVKKQRTNYEAMLFRQNHDEKNIEYTLEELESKLGSIQIKDYKVENCSLNLSEPVNEIFSFISDNHCETVGDKIYVSPMLFFSTKSNPFKQEKRLMPIYFGYIKQEKYAISIEITNGYIVESLPTATTFSTKESNFGSFSFKIDNNDNKIQMVITTDINATVVPTEYYEVLKEFFKKMIDKQNEKIVLKKV